MADESEGGYAFPMVHEGMVETISHKGMTMRQWYASKALPAVIAAMTEGRDRDMLFDEELQRVACSTAFDYADMMILQELRGRT